MSTVTLPRLQALLEKTRKPRTGCQYSPKELAILNKYKAAYLNKTTHSERDIMLRTEMFVDIFNYWETKGIYIEDTEVLGHMKVSIITGYLNYLSNSNSRLIIGPLCMGQE
jgi:hypothetical protein